MNSRAWLRKNAGGATLALLLLATTPACAWDSEWTFAATKACYGGISGDHVHGSGSSSCYTSYPGNSGYSGGANEAGVLAIVFVGIILVPIVFDCACLPVEWVHDQLVCD